MCSGKRPRTANTVVMEKKKVVSLTLPNVQTHCKATVNKAVWLLAKEQTNGPRNKTENSETDTHKSTDL